MEEIINDVVSMCNNIYNVLGTGFAECIYHKALFYDLIEKGYQVETEKMVAITYKNLNIGYGRIDLFIKNKQNIFLIIELKAISGSIGQKELAQLNTYKKNIGIECGGIAINFPQSGSNTKLLKSDVEYITMI